MRAITALRVAWLGGLLTLLTALAPPAAAAAEPPPGATVPPSPTVTLARNQDGLGDALGKAGRSAGRALERAGEATGEALQRAGETSREAWITAKVKTRLAADPLVRASQIDVETRGSVVTLTGTVPSLRARTRALELALDTGGVRSVRDRLRVARP